MMRAAFMHPRMRREFLRRMFREMGDAPWHGDWRGCEDRWRERPSAEQRLAFLEEYQRDLEQQVADVATKIRRLKEEMAGSEEAPETADT